MSPVRRSLLAACAALLLSASHLSGETWALENGDRLTGTLIKDDGDALEIKHPHLGMLRLRKSALKLEAPPTGTAADLTVAEGPKAAAGLRKPASNWKRQLEFGFSQQSGTTSKEDLTIRGQLDAKLGDNTFRGTARLLQAESADRTVTDRREADFRWRHDLNKRLFTQTLTTYAADDVRLIDLSLEQQVGGGYRLVDQARHKMNVGMGAVVQYLEREGHEDATALLGSFFQDYAFTLNSRLKLTQESNVLVSESSVFSSLGGRSGLSGTPRDGNYRMRFNTAVQSKVTTQMSLNVRYEYDYDRSVPDPELRGDQRITTSLAYLW
ncbi:MAG TPA: DUF481 domain-containing protein [Opitutaceae bacterium]|nr:DUF481 domain-containing protein [Opitutaceae bacterium]